MALHLPLRALCAIVVFISSQLAMAGSEDALFASDETLQITLSGPIKKITTDRADEPEYQDGRLGITIAGSQEKWFDVGIRVRGKSRRSKEICRFPPLKLNFKKKQTADSIFAKQDKLKLVTHCNPRSQFEQYHVLEYLIYKALNLVTDNSFRVRRLQVHYLDGKKDRGTRAGFFIEHKDRLAKRIERPVAHLRKIKASQLEPTTSSILELFQFMIGNTDFSLLMGPEEDCCHNLVLFEDGEHYIPVAYDFDSTGLVNPPYAYPQEALKIKSVRRRLFRGFCREEIYLEKALTKFRDNKSNIYELFAEQYGLTKRNVKKSHKYLDSFYRVINSPKELDRKIIQSCRSPRARLIPVS